MRAFDWKYVPEHGLVLLTAEDLEETSPVCIADFRDTHALAFARSSGFVGWSGMGGMRLGKLPLHLIDGIWFLHEDKKGQEAYPEVQLRPGLLVLKPIP